MNYKIEVLADCNVIFVRNQGKYGSNMKCCEDLKSGLKKMVIGDMLKQME